MDTVQRFSTEGATTEVFCKKSVLKNFANFIGKYLCWSLFLIKLQTFMTATLLKRDSYTAVSFEICGIFKNTCFEEHLRTAASVSRGQLLRKTSQNLPNRVHFLVIGSLAVYLLHQKTYSNKSGNFSERLSGHLLQDVSQKLQKYCSLSKYSLKSLDDFCNKLILHILCHYFH